MTHPHAQTHYVRPAARTITCTTTSNPPSSHAMPAQQPPVHGPYGPAAGAPPRADGKPRKRKKSKSKHVRFNTPGPGPGPPPNATDAYQHQHAPAAGTSGEAAYGDQHQHHAAASHAYAPAPQGHGHGYGYGRYAPSPLTRWEMLGPAGTPRRHEYFSGEYRWYYPTPVREGIYSMATDANRLTAIFSEENPNACTIV